SSTATENDRGVASAVPRTRPTAAPATTGGSLSGEGLMTRHRAAPPRPSHPATPTNICSGIRRGPVSSGPHVAEQEGVVSAQDVGQRKSPYLRRRPGRNPARTGPGEQRRHGQADL